MPPSMKPLLVLLLAIMLASCQPSNSQPVPSVSQIGGDLKCAAGDHPFEDSQVGWGFCYPGTWKYNERSQGSASPSGLDLTFDITDVPCVAASAAPGSPTVAPICSPNAGLFAFMIVSTYDRGGATSIAGWVQANMTPVPTMESIAWGNAVEASKLDDGRRIALTPHHIVILSLHSGQANLNLESSMSQRLDTWKFLF